MRTIIAGSRKLDDYERVRAIVDQCPFFAEITCVVSGAAPGVDSLGERWAEERGIPVDRFPADWEQFGRSAGPRRNQQMAEAADALIAIPLFDSRGTHDMIRKAKAANLRVWVFEARVE